MGWTTPRNWVSGELVTAALLNTHVRDNLDHLYGLVGDLPTAANSLLCKAYRNGAQSIANNAATKVQLNAESFDLGNLFDKDTNYRFNVATTGYYQVAAQINFASAPDQGCWIKIYLGGAMAVQNVSPGAWCNCAGLIYATGGQAIELYCAQVNSGAAAIDLTSDATGTWLSIQRVG
jgi:hypothetical protein